MSKSLNAQIDALYAVPLAQFVAARTALAKTVSGDEAKRIKALAKPTTLPWVVNQLRWHERALYERLMKAGRALRTAQVAALEGRVGHVQDATATHRKALVDAVRAGAAVASTADVNVDGDALSRMLETVSLADTPSQIHGRFTEVVQPAGFEALLGVAVKPVVAWQRSAKPPLHSATPPVVSGGKPVKVDLVAVRAAARRQKAQSEAAERHARAIAAAERALAAAQEKEADAREAWHKARDRADAADQNLQALKKSPPS